MTAGKGAEKAPPPLDVPALDSFWGVSMNNVPLALGTLKRCRVVLGEATTPVLDCSRWGGGVGPYPC